MFRSLLLILLFSQMSMSAAENAFPKTNVGTVEIKTIPASRLIMSTSERSYFQSNNGLFMPLFRYISANDIAMTTPVEAEMSPGRMYFYLGDDVADQEFTSTDEVELVELPERKVASIGVRGGYSESNFKQANEQLAQWLQQHPEYESAGNARGIFWNGPYVPACLKRFEVHIPVKPRERAD